MYYSLCQSSGCNRGSLHLSSSSSSPFPSVSRLSCLKSLFFDVRQAASNTVLYISLVSIFLLASWTSLHFPLFLHFSLFFSPASSSSSFISLLCVSFLISLTPASSLSRSPDSVSPSITFSFWYTAVRHGSESYRTDPIRIQCEGASLPSDCRELVSSCCGAETLGKTDRREATGTQLLTVH